MIVTVHKVTL